MLPRSRTIHRSELCTHIYDVVTDYDELMNLVMASAGGCSRHTSQNSLAAGVVFTRGRSGVFEVVRIEF